MLVERFKAQSAPLKVDPKQPNGDMKVVSHIFEDVDIFYSQNILWRPHAKFCTLGYIN